MSGVATPAPAPATAPRVTLVASDGALRALADELRESSELAFDLEANGMFAYRARPCVVQLGWGGRVAIVDVLAAGLGALGPLLSEAGPRKIVHDATFDARLLAEAKLRLGNVHDTAVAARMLGLRATGLDTLLAAELGVAVGKELQKSDWGKRPLDAGAVAYLVNDVAHLVALRDVLWDRVRAAGIEPEVREETDHRLRTAWAAIRETEQRPAFARIDGASRLPGRALAILRDIAQLREVYAEQRDVPAHQVLPSERLVAMARVAPTSAEAVTALAPRCDEQFAGDVARVVREALAAGPATERERALVATVCVPPAVARARKQRHNRVSAWRRREASARGVDEQVVLPGHCLRDLAEAGAATLEGLLAVGGLGAFRVERYGAALLRVVAGAEETGG